MAKKWTEDDEVYLEHILFNSEDVPLKDIAEFLDRSVSSVANKRNILMKRDKNLVPYRRRYTEKEIEYLKKCYAKGIPLENMSKVMNRSTMSISRKAQLLGIITRKYAKDYDKEIRELAGQGLWGAEIGRRLGLSRKVVSEYINKNDIECEKASKDIFKNYLKKVSYYR